MKKNLTKLLALMMALALVFSLAACGDKTEEQSTNPSDNQAAASVNGDETVVPVDNSDPSAMNEDPSASDEETQTPGDTQTPGETQKPGDTQKPGNTPGATSASSSDEKLPTDKAALMNLFNNAKFSKALMSRTLSKGQVTALRIVKIDLSGEQAVKDAFKKSNAPIKVGSTKLSSVASASSSGTMKSGTITFNLANVSNETATKISHGKNGYLYFIDFNEAQTVANDILGALNLGSCTVDGDKSTISLSNGKIVATVKDGKVVKATLTFSESVVASAKYKGLPATATISGNGTVVYS